MEKKKYVRPRNVNLAFRVTQEERGMIESKMKMAGMTNMRAYIIKQIAEGHIIRVELDSVNEMIRLLSNATNNINQIARRVNGTGSIYASDIEDMKSHYDILWLQTREILKRLTAM